MASPVRFGVVGVGAIALRGILPHLTQADVADRVRVVAVCDVDRARADAVARRFDVPTVFGDVEEMLREGEIDAASIASPIGFHYEHCRRALDAGKHVHVNKTMTTTVREADELIALSRERMLHLVPSPGEVLRPQLMRTRELLAQGAIGRPTWVICGGAFADYHERGEPERTSVPGAAPINPAWYFRAPGGGPLYDITVYALHQLTSVLGPARAVTALSGIRVAERTFLGSTIATEVDDNTILLLDFGDGLLAVAYGAAAGELSDQFGAGIYHGTAGTIEGVLLNGEPFDFRHRDQTLDGPVTDWEAQMRVLPHVVGPHRAIPESHVFEDIMQLVDWIIDGTPTVVGVEQARHVIDIIESGYRAARTGTTQELSTSFELPPLEPSAATPGAT